MRKLIEEFQKDKGGRPQSRLAKTAKVDRARLQHLGDDHKDVTIQRRRRRGTQSDGDSTAVDRVRRGVVHRHVVWR